MHFDPLKWKKAWVVVRKYSVTPPWPPEREVRGSKPTAAVLCPWARHFTPRKYWLITQEAMAPSWHDWNIVDWDVKPQHNQPTTMAWSVTVKPHPSTHTCTPPPTHTHTDSYTDAQCSATYMHAGTHVQTWCGSTSIWAASWQNQQCNMLSAKTQISLGICPVWSESSLSTWRKLGSLATH